MRESLKILLVGTALFLIGHVLRTVWVRDVVPIAFEDKPQAIWAVETAFVLSALKYVGAACVAIAMLAFLTSKAR
jgi:hypothetical protein